MTTPAELPVMVDLTDAERAFLASAVALFLAREGELDDAQAWRLIAWRDLAALGGPGPAGDLMERLADG